MKSKWVTARLASVTSCGNERISRPPSGVPENHVPAKLLMSLVNAWRVPKAACQHATVFSVTPTRTATAASTSEVPGVSAGACWSGQRTRPRLLRGSSSGLPSACWGESGRRVCRGGDRPLLPRPWPWRHFGPWQRAPGVLALRRAPAAFTSCVLPLDMRTASSRDRWPGRDLPPRWRKPAEPPPASPR